MSANRCPSVPSLHLTSFMSSDPFRAFQDLTYKCSMLLISTLITFFLQLVILIVIVHRQRPAGSKSQVRRPLSKQDRSQRLTMEQDSGPDQSSRLLSLPDEVLVAVLSHLERTDQRNARLVCRPLKNLADPFTFTEFVITHGADAIDLAYLIGEDPVRATWIRELLVSTKLEGRDGLEHVPAVLPLMKNMRKLILETPDCNSKQALQRIPWVDLQRGYENVFKNASVDVPRESRLLPQLHECTLHFVDDSTCLYSMTKYSHVFLHPTLRSLRMSCACTDDADRLLVPYQTQYRRSTALSHLHLEECDFDPRALAVLLSFPAALSSLVISEGTRYSDSSTTRSRMHGNLFPHELSTVLTDTSSTSLQSLSLDLGFRRNQYETITQPGRFLDLTQMSCLRKLSLSFMSFALVVSYPRCDHQIHRRLPPSLQSLRIFKMPFIIPRFGERRYDPSIPHDSCLVRDKTSHGLPHLNELIWTYEYHDSDTPTILALLNRRFENEPFQRQITLAKRFVTDRCNKTLYEYQKAGIRMIAEVTITPAGYIPPYLHNEDQPRTELIWDSAHPPLDGQNLAARAKWKEQMRSRLQHTDRFEHSPSSTVQHSGNVGDAEQESSDKVQEEDYPAVSPGEFEMDDSDDDEEDEEDVVDGGGLMMEMTPELQILLGLLRMPAQPQHP